MENASQKTFSCISKYITKGKCIPFHKANHWNFKHIFHDFLQSLQPCFLIYCVILFATFLQSAIIGRSRRYTPLRHVDTLKILGKRYFMGHFSPWFPRHSSQIHLEATLLTFRFYFVLWPVVSTIHISHILLLKTDPQCINFSTSPFDNLVTIHNTVCSLRGHVETWIPPQPAAVRENRHTFSSHPL